MRPCPAVVDAVSAAVSRGDTGYALTEEYAAEVAAFAEAEWAWGFDPRTTTRVADVLTGVTHLLGLFTDAGGPVVVSPPVYNAFYEVIEACGRRVVEAPLGADHRLDLERLAEVVRAGDRRGRAGGIPAVQPAQPDGHGAHAGRARGARPGRRRARRARGLRRDPRRRSSCRRAPSRPTSPCRAAERGVTVTSASKAWNLAGLKAAIIVPGDAAVDDVRRLHPFVTFGASHLGVIAQTAAYRDGREWVHRLVDELDANRRLLTDLVAEHLPGARLAVPEATYLAWLDLTRRCGLGDDPAGEVLRRARVALSPGRSFGSGGARARPAQLRHVTRDPPRRGRPDREHP